MNPPDAATPESAPPPPEAEATELAALTRRIAKMQNQILQDLSSVRQAVAGLAQAVPGSYESLHATFAMVARNVALGHVKGDEAHLETRKLVTTQFESLAERLSGELLDRVVERIVLAALAEVVDDAEAVLQKAPPDQRAAPPYEALRMVRSKLIGALESLGIELIRVAPGESRYDAELHECAGRDGRGAADVVTEVYANGYKLKGRAIRRAKVVVGGGA